MKNTFLLIATLITLSIFFVSCDKEDDDPIDNTKTNQTTLIIKVMDKDGAAVQGASVRIFNDDQNWSNDKNPTRPNQSTNASGFVTFTELDAIEYYFIAEKGSLNNWFENSDTGGPITKDATASVSTVIR